MGFYVYEDWTLEEIHRCFYVGKGAAGRVKELRRNRHHTNITQKYGVNRKIVFSSSIEQLTLNFEVELIAKRKTYVYGDDYTLGANYTRGGEGVSGVRFVWSDKRHEDARIAQQRSFQKPERRKQHVEATKKQWNDAKRDYS